MDTANSNRELTVELLVRSQAGTGAREKQQAVIKTLEQLKQREVIDDFVVRVCGSEVCKGMPADDELDGRSIVSLVTRIQQWATTRQVSLENVFREKTISSSFVDEEYTVIKLPYLSLLVFEGGSLSEVYPCYEAGGSFCPIDESIQELCERAQVSTPDEVTVG